MIAVEPNAWSRFGYDITPVQHAKDFSLLKDLVNKEDPWGKMVVGPDVANDPDYLNL